MDVLLTFTTVSIVNVPVEDACYVSDRGTNVYSVKLSDAKKTTYMTVSRSQRNTPPVNTV